MTKLCGRQDGVGSGLEDVRRQPRRGGAHTLCVSCDRGPPSDRGQPHSLHRDHAPHAACGPFESFRNHDSPLRWHRTSTLEQCARSSRLALRGLGAVRTL